MAGNKAKIAQLRDWMKENISKSSTNNILLITGPSGKFNGLLLSFIVFGFDCVGGKSGTFGSDLSVLIL